MYERPKPILINGVPCWKIEKKPYILNSIGSEEDRRQNIKIEEPHATAILLINGKKIKVDKEILPILEWLNDLNGVITQWSCHGNFTPNSPYVVFTSSEFEITKFILKTFHDFYHHKKNNYHLISTEIEYFDINQINDMNGNSLKGTPEIRFISRWFDHVALLDFCDFLKY